jgi:hypothetical protein
MIPNPPPPTNQAAATGIRRIHMTAHNLKLRALLIATIVLPLVAITAPEAGAITIIEIKTLTKLGISPDEIIKAIEKDREVFNLSVQDILSLKKGNVHKRVLKYMLSTPQRFRKRGATSTTETKKRCVSMP